MAVADDIRSLHERINALDKTMGERHEQLVTSLAGIGATCEICRPIVLGNGGDSIDVRVDRLETAAGSRRTWFWFLAAAVISLLAAMVGGGITILVQAQT